MSNKDFSRLKREILAMPDFVSYALNEEGLMAAYKNRPPYQQNDYISWITRAKREETQDKRLRQMLSELKRGDLYMKMNYKPKKLPGTR